MINEKLKLHRAIFSKNAKLLAQRDGFGEGIFDLGKENPKVVALCADLKDSVRLTKFAENFPDRYIEMGIAEQNMAGVAAGLSHEGKIPYMCSHAIFNPARNWDQIRVSICISNSNVKIIGSHCGFSNGKDGAVAESLEDIALMRVLPNLTVVHPIDFIQTKKSVKEIANIKGPVYLRFSKTKTPQITTDKTPFKVGKAYVLSEGDDLTIISAGPIIHEVLLAARNLKSKHKINCEVIASPTIKPLDEETLLKSIKKTKKVVTIEEHQVIGGLGSVISELTSSKLPVPVLRIGVEDTFGESGSYNELKDKYGLSSHHIENKVINFLKKT